MKLFNDFEAVKFPEENMIFITHNGFLYYIYDSKLNHWRKHRNAGNDLITVQNYPDVSKDELMGLMNGVFPSKETDFMRLCYSSELCISDMLDLLKEDYPDFIADYAISYTVRRFLSESEICYKSYESIKKVFDSAVESHLTNEQILVQMRDLCFTTIGRDIFKKEIGIVDGHNSSSYFWIMPVRIIDDSDTNGIDNVVEMKNVEISIEEDDVAQYLMPFLDKFFDDNLVANKERIKSVWEDDDGTEQVSTVRGFEWYLTHNFFTFDSIEAMLKDINDTIDALSSGRENEFTATLRVKRGTATNLLVYAKELTEEQLKEHNANRPKEDATESDILVNFYQRFIYRMEYMLKVGKEKGFDLISFMGP